MANLPRIIPSGDTAIVIRQAPRPLSPDAGAPRLAAWSQALGAAALPGVVDIVASPDCVTVVYDPLAISSLADLTAHISQVVQAVVVSPTGGTTHEVPVCYGADDGPDCDAVCRHHGISTETLIRLHTGPDYLVTAIGFVPGFPYLAGLDEQLATPRRASPRTRIPAGSVGIGGSQTGIYPFATPGGWQLIGRTDFPLFDVTAPQPARLHVGDRLRFRETAERPSPVPPPAVIPAPAQHSRTVATVLSPGLLTTVQDLGRPGHRAAGVPSGGAADSLSARLANRLVGNQEAAALLEFSLTGPTLRFETATTIAIAGGSLSGLPTLRPLAVRAGDLLELGHLATGCRGYLAIAGGLSVPCILGSRSTYLPASFGGLSGRPLAAGDQLQVNQPARLVADHSWTLSPSLVPIPPPGGSTTLRFIPSEPDQPATVALAEASLRVLSSSDRMGLRMAGSLPAAASDGVSRGVLPGTIQLPPDGNPILLLADAQTIGGYPAVGQVIAADLPLAGQLRPGADVRFEPTSIPTAHRLLREQQEMLAPVWRGIATHLRPLGAATS